MMRLTSVAVAALALACAAPQEAAVQQPAPFDPVGTYDFTTVVEGRTVPGVITIRRDDQGVLRATLSSQVTGDLAINSVTQDGRKLDMRTSLERETLLMKLDFLEDDRIAGGWELSSGASGSVTGRRRGT